MSKVEHYDRAEHFVAAGWAGLQKKNDDRPEVRAALASVFVAIAQVHATLALVDAQKTAATVVHNTYHAHDECDPLICDRSAS